MTQTEPYISFEEIRDILLMDYEGILSKPEYCTESQTVAAQEKYGNTLYFFTQGVQGIQSLCQKAYKLGIITEQATLKSGLTAWAVDYTKIKN